MNKSRHIPYPTLLAATKGDTESIQYILHHFEGFICSLAKRQAYRADGSIYHVVDEEIRNRMETTLIQETLKFEFR